MPIIATAGDSKSYTPAPEGTHQAVCVDVIDIGLKPNPFKDGAMQHTTDVLCCMVSPVNNFVEHRSLHDAVHIPYVHVSYVVIQHGLHDTFANSAVCQVLPVFLTLQHTLNAQNQRLGIKLVCFNSAFFAGHQLR